MDEHTPVLARDLARMVQSANRRQVLTWLGVAACLPQLGCADDTPSESGCCTDATGDSGTDGAAGTGTCETIPEETAGPYPGDGSNGPNVLALEDVVRSDIRDSIGSLSGTAAGVQLTVKLRIVDSSCGPRVGYAVYLWHADRDGNYSMYDIEDQNYLRGVQVTDDQGEVTFVTCFPGCYDGRWPHIHFEVYPDLASINSASNAVATSQLALPASTCEEVYAESGYEDSVSNFAAANLDTDNVFSDGATEQTPSVTGSVSAGLVATLDVGV